MKNKNLSKIVLAPFLAGALSLNSCKTNSEEFCKIKEYPTFKAEISMNKGREHIYLEGNKGKKIYSGYIDKKSRNVSYEELKGLKRIYKDVNETGLNCETYKKVKVLEDLRKEGKSQVEKNLF